ncbi:MAG TPA: Ig-like domain-containing protein, partial [Candidatus Nanopelagicales bacterium]|nr:Ig-like domain-containing protein [Candidatus Nanopelagicales bacterium]
PAPIQADNNAVAPFSVGRNTVAGSPLRIEGGFSAARALYNVVRQRDLNQADIVSIFSTNGFICSPAAKPLITAAGFQQLLPPSKGGVCGVATQDPTTNLATEQVATTTTASGTSTSAGVLNAVATVAAPTGSPNGIVTFFVDGVAAGSVPPTAGKATRTITGLTPGSHSLVAKYAPGANSVFLPSDSAATPVNVLAATPAPPVVTKASTKIVEKYKASYARGAVVKNKVLIKESAAGSATGKVLIKRGSKTVGKGVLQAGKAVIKLKGLKAGMNKLVAIYKGDSKFLGSKLKFKITIK